MHDVFLSPAAFLAHLRKSKFHYYSEKSLESMENPGKAWEIPGKHVKSLEGIENTEKA